MAKKRTVYLDPIAVGDERNVSLNFEPMLDAGELLTGSPIVVEQTTSDLTLSNKAVNTVALVIDDVDVAIGEAVQYHMSGQVVANSPYTVLATATTDATPAQKLNLWVEARVVDE